VCDVVAKLSADCKNIKLNAKVARVSPGTGVGGKGGKVGWTDGVTGEAKEESFDAVVIATQAHHAKNLLTAGKGNPTTIDALGCWGHEASRVVVHTDPRLMPARESDWSNVNLILENENAKCFEGGVKNEKFKVDPRAWPSSSNLKEQVRRGRSEGRSEVYPDSKRTKLTICSSSPRSCAVSRKARREYVQHLDAPD